MWTYEYPNQLQHYGVSGMKWGVRRDIRLLANHRRNVAVKDARERYKTGKISKATKQSRIQKADAARKQDIERLTNKYLNAKTSDKKLRVENNISRQTMKEIPDYKIKRGAATVHKTLSKSRTKALGIASVAGLVAANPALAVAGATGMAVSIGANYITSLGLDKLS